MTTLQSDRAATGSAAPVNDGLDTSVFRRLPYMGVIRVNQEAMKLGYIHGDPAWSNLGQGQPEVGDLTRFGAPERINTFDVLPDDHAYGPIEGINELRDAVADHYNRLYRQGRTSQYTRDNIAIAAGGRLALTRCGATLNSVRLGYFTPDYTAYEDLLTAFPRIQPVHIELSEEDHFRIDPASLEKRIDNEDLGALLISNPCNPTGVVIEGDELARWVDMARRRNVTLLMDEFYSHFIYPPAGESFNESDDAAQHRSVSSARYVEDVNEDPVIIFDGLTKCFRYPGWRVGWIVAPKDVISNLAAAGSFLDGGPSRPVQRAALTVLEPDRANQETDALRRAFVEKQRITREALQSIGIEFPYKPGTTPGTFYLWGSVANLPAPLNDGIGFMREAMKHRVLTVPGEYFDVNPHRVREGESPLKSFVRFSFGPPRDNVEQGLSRLREMVDGFGVRG